MQLLGFQVFNFRNIIDSQWVRADRISSFIAQNECGKSNLLEAFYKLNPYMKDEKYNLNEDWPADKWGESDENATVCSAKFKLTLEEYAILCKASPLTTKEEGESQPGLPNLEENSPLLEVTVDRSYSSKSTVTFHSGLSNVANLEGASKWFLDNMPKFVYMEDYAFFGGTTDLDQLSQRISDAGNNRSKLSKEDQTILIILDLAKIDVKKLHAKGAKKEERTNRGFDTLKASNYLTTQFATLWRQKEVRFHIRVDGPTLDIHVEDFGMGMPVRLERRSQGFRWYVSFIWQFSHASRGEFKNCILLLDEPGVHLHPAGHRDLLDFMERLALSNTVIYTTHLATMVDPAYPERVRIMEVRDHHATVKNGMYSPQAEPMMVIEQALGLTPSMSGLLGTRQTLIVEGGEDAIVIQKLSGVLSRAGFEGLNDRIYLMPSKGASKTPMYAGFMIGQKLDAAVLLDSDDAGREAKKKIEELFLKELAVENKAQFRVLMLGDSAGIVGEAAIEDLFPLRFFLECCGEAYRIIIDEADLPGDENWQICKRVEAVIQKRNMGSDLDKKRVLLKILKKFETIQSAEDLPEGTLEKARRLIQKINRAFGHETQVKKTSKRQPEFEQ